MASELNGSEVKESGAVAGPVVDAAVNQSTEVTREEKKALKMISTSDKLIYLLPEEILVPESLDVRPYSGGFEADLEAIQNLAATIKEETQINPVKVRIAEGGKYELVAGRRRVSAISLINAEKSAKEAQLRVKCVCSDVALSDGHAYRQAMIENVHRENISPMDMAVDIKNIQERFGWKGNVKKVADFLKVSPATVTQHLKLLDLPVDVQRDVHTGKISRDAAFALSKVSPEKREEVVKKAEELQETEKEKKAGTGKTETKDGGKKVTGRDTGSVATRHVKAAAREVEPDKPQPRTRKEILEWFDEIQGPAYGFENGSIHTWARQFLLWAGGKLSDRTMEKYFSAMVEKADRGKSVKAEEGKAKAKK